MCQVLQVSRSGYYAWRDRPPSPRAVRRAERLAQIHELFDRSRGRYGSPKITATLRQATYFAGGLRETGFLIDTCRNIAANYFGSVMANGEPSR